MTDLLKKYLAWTFFINFGIVAVFALSGGEWNTWYAMIVGVLYMFIPFFVSYFLIKKNTDQKVKDYLGIRFKINKWWFVAWLLMPALAFATFGVSLLFPDIVYSPEMTGMFERFKDALTPEKFTEMQEQVKDFPVHPIWLAVVQGLVAGPTVNAIAGFGEEAGWRGLMMKELSGGNFWQISVFIGFIWGVWHAPLIAMGHNYPEHPIAGIFMMTIWCILLWPLFTYIRIKAKSVIGPAIMHGTLNSSAGIAIMLIAGGSDLTAGMTGLAGFIVLAAANLGLYIYDTRIDKEGITQMPVQI